MTQAREKTTFRKERKPLSKRGIKRKNSDKEIDQCSVANELPDLKVKVAFGVSVYDNRIVRKKITLKQLFKLFQTPEIRKDKYGKYFVFASFKAKKRNAGNLNKYYGATLDIDDTELTLSEIRSAFSAYTSCIYSTFSHRHKGKGNRYRVVIPYSVPLPAEEHVGVLLYLNSLMGQHKGIDLSAKALSIPAHLPAVSEKFLKKFVCVENCAELLNPYSNKLTQAIPLLQFERYADAEQNDDLDLSKEISEGERNSVLTRIAGKFIYNGVATSDLFDMVNTYNETKSANPLEASEVKVICDSIIQKHKKSNNDLSWGFDEIMHRINASKDMPGDFEHLCKMIANAQINKKIAAHEFEMVRNELTRISKVAKKVVNATISNSSMELQGDNEKANEELIEANADNLRERFKDWVYIAAEDRLYNTYNGLRLTREAFNAKFIDKSFKSGVFGVLAKFGIINKVDRSEFNPEEGLVYNRDRICYANTYIDPDITPRKGNVDIMLDHFTFLFPNDRERGIFLDFIAHLIQFPGKKIRWMLIIKGGKGIGKTIIGEALIYHLIGFANLGKVSNSLIKSDFNAWQLDKQLLVFEEIDVGMGYKQKEEMTNKLKEFITDSFLKAHKKGQDPYDVINKACCLAFTNSEWSVIITPDERRFCMLRTNARPKSVTYYEDLIEFFDNNVEEIYHYFYNRDLEGFHYSVAPMTKYTKEIKAMSLPYPGGVLQDIIRDKYPKYSKVGAMPASLLVEIVQSVAAGKYITMANELLVTNSTFHKSFYGLLKTLNFTPFLKPGAKSHRFHVRGSKQIIWCLPGRKQSKKLAKYNFRTIVAAVNAIKVSQDNTLAESEFDELEGLV